MTLLLCSIFPAVNVDTQRLVMPLVFSESLGQDPKFNNGQLIDTDGLTSFLWPTLGHFSLPWLSSPTVSLPYSLGVTGKFGLGMQNEAGQRLIEFCQENTLVIANTVFEQHKRRLYTWTYQMVNTEIRLIIFFAARDGEALYSQQKQDQELTVAQIMNFLLPYSDSNWSKQGKPPDHSGMT